MRTCAAPGCDRVHHGRGWCAAHYRREFDRGDAKPDVPVGAPGNGADMPSLDELKRSPGWATWHPTGLWPWEELGLSPAAWLAAGSPRPAVDPAGGARR